MNLKKQIRKLNVLRIQWHGQYKKLWSKWNQDGWKVTENYSYLLRDGQKS